MKRWNWFLIAVALLAVLTLAGCRDNDPDDDVLVDATPAPGGACEENQAPELTGAAWLIEGALTTDAPTFAEFTAVELFVAFADADCNLAGGQLSWSLDGEDTETAKLDSDLGCSSTANEMAPSITVAGVGVGEHSVQVTVTDSCGAPSNTLTMPFTLTAYQDTDDDATGDDDDTAPEATTLAGQIDYVGEATDLTDRTVNIFLFATWLPGGNPATAFTQVSVPGTGFPFAYSWDLSETAAAPGDYYLFAYLDWEDDDGLFNEENDPVHAPYVPTTIVDGMTTTANITLVAPGK